MIVEKPWFEVKHYIGGEFVDGGSSFEIFYPATNEVIGTAPEGKEAEVDAAVDAGTVWVNDFFVRDLRVPFGGMKQSGIGRDGGVYAREFFTEARTYA
jgi:acyl-CoA reductase-like NAD-dependent aldehyde dehydrogenase